MKQTAVKIKALKGGQKIATLTAYDYLTARYVDEAGIPLVLVDTDGDHEVLTPLFLEAGVNGFGPIERAAGMDPVDLRRRYGKAFCMLGGIDKREIAKDRAAIDREIDRAIRPLVAAGGFIPMIDHAVPPDVSLDNFQYYLERKRNAVLG